MDEEHTDRIYGFNLHRDLVARKLQCSIILWLTKEEITRFALKAPDMWSWRKAVINFSVEIAPLGGYISFEVNAFDNIPFISYRIDDRYNKALIQCYKAVVLYEIGNLNEALSLLNSCVTIFENLGDKLSKAEAESHIACIFLEEGT